MSEGREDGMVTNGEIWWDMETGYQCSILRREGHSRVCYYIVVPFLHPARGGGSSRKLGWTYHTRVPTGWKLGWDLPATTSDEVVREHVENTADILKGMSNNPLRKLWRLINGEP